MTSKTSSNSTLVKCDSGIDIVSVGGVSSHSTQIWNSKISSPTSTPTSSSSEISIDTGSEREDADQKPQTLKQKYCPPSGPIGKWLTWFIILSTTFGVVYAVVPDHMKPGEELFSLILTILLCIAAEQLIVKIPTPRRFPCIPPLLASLLMGLALRNIPVINVASTIKPESSGVLRELALTVILTRAGLEVDCAAIKKLKWAVVRLAFVPCIFETVVIGILTHYLLGFPFEWSFMTGFMIAAVSPAVVIPSLIILQDVGFGTPKGIPSLVMAASGIDDVLAIAGFTVLLGIAIPTGLEEDIISKFTKLAQGHVPYFVEATYPTPTVMNSTITNNTITSTTDTATPHDVGKDVAGAIVEILIGIVAGLFFGFFISYFPSRQMRHRTFCRGFLLLGIGIFFVFGSAVWGIPGAGSLCALITSFVASLHWNEERKPLEVAWHYMWIIFQPILFGLTGALVDVSLMDANTIGLGLTALGVALMVRLMVSCMVTFGLKFNLKEKVFVAVAWLPKGTVQAALGSAALYQAIEANRPPEEIRWGEQILILAVLITLITAPLGAFGINLFGPRLLTANIGIELESQVNKAYVDNEPEGDDHDNGCHDNSARRSSLETKSFHGMELKIKDCALDDIKEVEDEKMKESEDEVLDSVIEEEAFTDS